MINNAKCNWAFRGHRKHIYWKLGNISHAFMLRGANFGGDTVLNRQKKYICGWSKLGNKAILWLHLAM